MRLLSDAIALCFLTACGGGETSSHIDGLYTFRDCYDEIERHAFILAISLPFDRSNNLSLSSERRHTLLFYALMYVSALPG